MRRPAALSLVVAASLVAAGVVLAQDGAAPWDEALKARNEDAATLQLSASRWRGGGDRSLPIFEKAWNDWRFLEAAPKAVGRELLAAISSFTSLVDVGAHLAGIDTATTTVAPVATHTRADLVAAIVSLEARLGEPLAAERRADLEHRIANVPEDVAGRAAIVLEAVPEALDALDDALAGFKPTDVPKEKWRAVAYQKALGFGREYDVDAATLELVATFDRAALVRGARALARAVDAAGRALHGAHGAFSFEWETSAGTIALGGDADDVYDKGPYLLVIDTGGDDTYRPRLPSNPEQYPIAISIDFAGNDLYVGDGLAFGTGVTGYGFLLDVAGDDRYLATDVGPGSGIFGVGIAIDRAGNDLHVVHRFGEGAGVFGIGILADIAGNDEYRCLQMAQGYGGTLGVGALVDASGDDLYLADDEHLECPSAQTKDHNVNLSQGCGFGRRAHPGDGHSFAGGLGVLVDGAGNDRYRCGVFGQGTGYWYAMGLLVDFAGDDDYKGAWYVQGSAAHFAVAALCDLAGNDHYVATMNQSQGAGHDGSIGILEDAAGDDVYECSGAGQGFGHWNGIGLLLDLGGQNRYTGSGQAFGCAQGADGGQIAAGIFVDLGKATFLSKPTPVATDGNLHQVRYVR